jgi:hypothetical protein
VSVTWEAFFVDEARLRSLYASNDESLIARVEATRHFRFLVDLGAGELARNLEYAKKVAPRPYEPLERVSLDPPRALRDIVLGRPLRPMGVEFYDTILRCICDVIGTRVDIDDPSTVYELAVESERHTVHPYLPVPAVRRPTVAAFSIFSPAACAQLLEVVDDDEWVSALEQRDDTDSMLVFGA